jgi:hypothetical protein
VINYLLRNYDKSNAFSPNSTEQVKVDFDKWTFFLVSTLGPIGADGLVLTLQRGEERGRVEEIRGADISDV